MMVAVHIPRFLYFFKQDYTGITQPAPPLHFCRAEALEATR